MTFKTRKLDKGKSMQVNIVFKLLYNPLTQIFSFYTWKHGWIYLLKISLTNSPKCFTF